jgi:hypothetical protein
MEKGLVTSHTMTKGYVDPQSFRSAALRNVCTSDKPQLFISRSLHSLLLDHEDGGSMFLRNGSKLLPDYIKTHHSHQRHRHDNLKIRYTAIQTVIVMPMFSVLRMASQYFKAQHASKWLLRTWPETVKFGHSGHVRSPVIYSSVISHFHEQ